MISFHVFVDCYILLSITQTETHFYSSKKDGIVLSDRFPVEQKVQTNNANITTPLQFSEQILDELTAFKIATQVYNILMQ